MDVTWVEYTDELISAADFDDAASLLGLPEDNVACYVIAEDNTETDPASDTWDTPGELCLAGPQVGLNHLNRDAQTRRPSSTHSTPTSTAVGCTAPAASRRLDRDRSGQRILGSSDASATR